MRAHNFLRSALSCFGFALLFSAQSVLAETIPAGTGSWAGYPTYTAYFDTLFAAYDGASPLSKICSRADSLVTSIKAKSIFKTFQYNTQNCTTAAQTVYVDLVAACPAGQNWTYGGGQCTRPDCVLPQVRSSSTGVCQACGDEGTIVSSGFYDVGDNPQIEHPPIVTCSTTGCEAIYNGASIGSRGLVAGVYHYYAKGSYVLSNQSCSSGLVTPNVVSSTTETCAAGQSSATMNGRTICVNPSPDGGTVASGNSPAAVDGAKGSIASEVEAVGTLGGGMGLDPSAISTGQGTVLGGGGGAVGVGGTDDIVTADFCRRNPYNPICVGITSPTTTPGQEQQAVNFCADNPGVPACVNFCTSNPTSSICVDLDYGSVEDSTLETKDINVAISPVVVGGAGSCPAPSPMVLHGQTYFFKWDTYCNYATGIKPILLAFAWLSAAGLLIGGFKT